MTENEKLIWASAFATEFHFQTAHCGYDQKEARRKAVDWAFQTVENFRLASSMDYLCEEMKK